jgi:hypothetical protein
MIAIKPSAPAREAFPRCVTCAHFDARPAAIEAALPGLQSFGSVDSAVRSTDGVCVRMARYLSADRWCEEHAAAGPLSGA